MSRREHLLSALQALNPQYIDLVDESDGHANGHESHYKLTLVSPKFVGLNPVQRHRVVYAALGHWMSKIHALAIHAYTLEEWSARSSAPESPVCAGSH
ncbi:BolA protein [Azomonas agilis]|uniref:BolA protein n=1 Tax=Azomonas agilis TaxID=116849 RepID=A0A562IY60_9GAMM|nr:BolA family protein [Azomonas agilis]TWH75793.1 BolA protein [Azomonas agilis]